MGKNRAAEEYTEENLLNWYEFGPNCPLTLSVN